MKSEKPVKKLEEIVLPFLLTPTEDITGGVNGRNFFFPAGQQSPLTFEQYEALLHSQYAKQLKH